MATSFLETYATDSGSNLNGGTGGTVVSREGWQSGANQFKGSSLDLSGVSAAGNEVVAVRPSGVDLPCLLGLVTGADDSADTIDWSSTKKFVDASTARVCAFVSGNGADSGTTIYDLCGNTISRDGTGSYTSTAQSKYGGSSIYCPGSYASGFRIAHNTNQQFGSGAFTLACWVRVTDKEKLANSCIHKYGYGSGATENRSWGFGIAPTSGGSNRLWLTYSTGGTSATQVDVFKNATLANDTWYHIAICRSGNTLYWFLDGVSLGTTAFSATLYNGTSDVCVGRYGTFSGSSTYDTLALGGWISGILITNTAVWTSGFTPPTSHLTATVGGEWANPQGASYWPLDQSGFGALQDGSGNRVRYNVSGASTMTAGITVTTSATAPVRVEGYTSTAGDEGHWTCQSSSAINQITIGASGELLHTNVVSTASTGTGAGVILSSTNAEVHSCVIHGQRGQGILASGSGGGSSITGCEIYDVGKANTSGHSAISLGSSATMFKIARNKLRDSSGSNIAGIRVVRGGTIVANEVSAMGAEAIVFAPTQAERLVCKDNYLASNGSHGIKIDSTSAVAVVSCDNNVITSNTGTGIYGTGSSKRLGTATNNAFRANAAETSSLDCICESGSITLTAAPYVDGVPSDEITGTGLWDLDGVTNYVNVGPYYVEPSGAAVFPVIGSSVVRLLGVWSNA